MLTNVQNYGSQLIFSDVKEKQIVYVNENGLIEESIDQIMRHNQFRMNGNVLIWCLKNRDGFVTGGTEFGKLKGPIICWDMSYLRSMAIRFMFVAGWTEPKKILEPKKYQCGH